MSSHRSRQVVVAGFDARPTEATQDLIDLVRLLQDQGLAPHVLLVGDGERLAELRRLAPVTVVNDFRWRGLAVLPSLVRADRVTRGLKSRRLRRWVRRRADRAWIVQHPTASGVLRHATVPLRVVAACLPDGTSLGDVDQRDRDALDLASVWIAADDDQAEGLRATGGEVLVIELDDPGSTDPAEAGDPSTWPVLLVPTPDAWDAINHTDEVARHLARHHPDVPVLWLASEGQERWLARHDLAAAGLEDTVVLAGRDELRGRLLRAVVRTGYGPAHHDLIAHAEAAHVPALGLCGPDEAPTPDRVAPLAVDDLLRRLDDVLTDPATLATFRSQIDERRDRRARLLAARRALRDRLAPDGT